MKIFSSGLEVVLGKFCVQNKHKGLTKGKELSTLSSIPWVGKVAEGLHCSSFSDVLGVDYSRERVRAVYVEDYFIHINTACLYLEDTWSTQSWLHHSWKQTCHLPWGSDLKNTTGPSLTQADRFLLVFRVCSCLAPFEIGYDVGGKAPASEPCGVWSAAACHFLHGQSREGRTQFPNFFNAYVCGFGS